MSLLIAGRRRWAPLIFDPGAPPVNVVVDGNSIADNYYTAIGTFDNHLMTVEPLASSGATHSCYADSGHSWAQMTADAAAVDAAWVEGSTNILVIGETINSVYDGLTAAQVQADISAYLSGRLALHPWRVIYWLTLPYGGGPSYASFNATMNDVDAWSVANADTLGIELIVDPRTIPTFAHDGLLAAPFEVRNDEWQENSPPFVHPLDAPKLELAALIVAAMETMHA